MKTKPLKAADMVASAVTSKPMSWPAMKKSLAVLVRRTAHSPINRVCEQVAQVAPYDIPVLISGEFILASSSGAPGSRGSAVPRWCRKRSQENTSVTSRGSSP